jgi:hypothetical protein
MSHNLSLFTRVVPVSDPATRSGECLNANQSNSFTFNQLYLIYTSQSGLFFIDSFCRQRAIRRSPQVSSDGCQAGWGGGRARQLPIIPPRVVRPPHLSQNYVNNDDYILTR